MNTSGKIPSDDPRLTLYALGEMEAAERAEFEALLAQDAEARAAVAEIRQTATLLGEALDTESTPASSAAEEDFARAVVERAAQQPARDELKRGGTLLRFPSLYYTIAGLAAACFAVVFVLNESEQQRRQVALGEAGERANATMAMRKSSVPGAEDFSVTAAPAPMAMAAPRVASEPLPATAMRMAAGPVAAEYSSEFVATAERAVSRFPTRVGTESYVAVRDQLRQRVRPERASVQVAELVNAFRYSWPAPADGGPFSLVLEESSAPWSKETRVVRVGVRGEGAPGMLLARDARAQVEFNPERVRAWRLIGFERDGDTVGVRGLASGEIVRGGDAVTVLYEILPTEQAAAGASAASRLASLVVDYRTAEAGEARRVAREFSSGTAAFAQASADQKFATAVAAFGLALREDPASPSAPWPEIARWAEAGAGDDESRREFVELVARADALED